MAIGFNSIPGNIKAPIFAFEVNSGGQFENTSRLLLIGHKNSGAPAADNVPIRCNNENEAITQFGKGSMLAEMMIAARRNAPAQDLWLMSVPAVGVAEVRTITVGTVPAAGGYGLLAIGDELIPLTINAGDSAATVATAIAAAINAYQNQLTKSGLPFTATASTNVVTLTARHAGVVFNNVDISIATVAGGNAFTGVLTFATTTPGSGSPDLSAGLAALGDDQYDWIVSPFADTANMTRYLAVMSDVSGRWAWNRQSYGHIFTTLDGTTSALTTFGLSYDSRHISILPRLTGAGMGTLPWVFAAAIVGRVVGWLSDGDSGNVSRNQTGLVVEGVSAPRDRTKWLNDYATRDAFLGSGLSTWGVRSDGQVTIDKLITTQRTDGAGNVDTTFRDVQAIGQLIYVLRFFRARLQAEHGQKAIANDNPSGLAALTTVQDIANTFIACYRQMDGVLENPSTFVQLLDVRRNDDNPNRVDVYAPIDRINPLDVLAANATLYSQYRVAAEGDTTMNGRDFGGEMRLRLQDGRNLTMRGAFTIGTSGISSESVTNQDASVSRVATLRPRTAEITLEDDGTDMNALLRAPRQDIYLTEDLTVVSHIFVNAFVSGDPRVNRANGEVTGLTIEASGYERRG